MFQKGTTHLKRCRFINRQRYIHYQDVQHSSFRKSYKSQRFVFNKYFADLSAAARSRKQFMRRSDDSFYDIYTNYGYVSWFFSALRFRRRRSVAIVRNHVFGRMLHQIALDKHGKLSSIVAGKQGDAELLCYEYNGRKPSWHLLFCARKGRRKTVRILTHRDSP